MLHFLICLVKLPQANLVGIKNKYKMKKSIEFFKNTFMIFGLIMFLTFVSSLIFKFDETEQFYWKKTFLSVLITSVLYSLIMPFVYQKVFSKFKK